MKFQSVLTTCTAVFGLASGFALPDEVRDISARDALAEPEAYSELDNTLEPRAGGGGGGGGGGRGGGGGSSSSGSSSSGSSSSGGRSSGGSSSSSSGSSSGSRGAGSYTGSGTTSPAYGRAGSTYSGGASTPYTAGSRSPRGLSPIPFVFGAGAVVGFSAAYWAASYPNGGYIYNFDQPVTYTNATNNNQTVVANVKCVCQRYAPCTCDDNEDSEYIQSLIGDGRWISFEQSRWIATVNGTGMRDSTSNLTAGGPNGTLVIGGTVNNGTGGVYSAAGLNVHDSAQKATWGAVAAAVGVAVMMV